GRERLLLQCDLADRFLQRALLALATRENARLVEVDVRFAKRRRHQAAAERDFRAAGRDVGLDRGYLAAFDADVDESGSAADATAAKNQIHVASFVRQRQLTRPVTASSDTRHR